MSPPLPLVLLTSKCSCYIWNFTISSMTQTSMGKFMEWAIDTTTSIAQVCITTIKCTVCCPHYNSIQYNHFYWISFFLIIISFYSSLFFNWGIPVFHPNHICFTSPCIFNHNSGSPVLLCTLRAGVLISRPYNPILSQDIECFLSHLIYWKAIHYCQVST